MNMYKYSGYRKHSVTRLLQIFCISLISAIVVIGCGKDSENVGTASTDASTSNLLEAEKSESILNAQSLIPASEQRAGDALAGENALVTEPIVSCGLPLSIWNQLDTGASLKHPTRTGPAASLPFNLNLIEDSNGVQVAASNCLTCHAAPLFGELVIGLGNEFLDFTVNPSVAVEQAGALATGEHEIAAWEKFADRIAAIAPYIQTDTVGVNPANNLTFALMAHRDAKTMRWLDNPALTPPPQNVPPVSVPPWWRMKKKHAMFSMGEGRGDHASFMMSAAILCADSIQEVQALDGIAPDIRAYISSLEPPAYPFPIDDDLAQAGQLIFDRTCSACHGAYGEQASYPNRLVDIAVVGTDASLIDFIFGDGSVYVDWFNQSPFGELAKAQPSRGYVAPPLDGVWSTAPFLHNGSVPTIRAVLDSTARPKLWQHRDRSSAAESSYSQANLGWHFIEPDAGAAADPWTYDTTRPGYANHGHGFGDALEDEQRDAVIEYLKTL